jgi:hypothetical protein
MLCQVARDYQGVSILSDILDCLAEAGQELTVLDFVNVQVGNDKNLHDGGPTYSARPGSPG